MVHQPVLEREITEALCIGSRGVILDCTLGGGGHTAAILQSSSPDVSVIGLDRDPDAVARCRLRLNHFGDRFIAIHASFGDVPDLDSLISDRPVLGAVMDLGVSSFQLDIPGRGFSFSDDQSLDMRFDPSQTDPSAFDLIERLSQSELADLIFRYGEEPRSRQIARAIIKSRASESIQNGVQLARVIRDAIGSHKGQRTHPATRTFQALRIAVNHELEHLTRGILWAVDRLAPSGRLAIISFHSLEDRIIKEQFLRLSGRCNCPPRLPECRCHPQKIIQILTRKPIYPTAEEMERNPRCRSAKLRIAEKQGPLHEN